MPVWHKATRPWVEQQRLVVLGVIQEQHAERCRLFAQWKQFEWPILHDPVNSLQLAAVPVLIAIDEHGVVRSTRPRPDTFQAEFLDKEFAAPAVDIARSPPAQAPDIEQLRQWATSKGSAAAWRELGDALVIWRGAGGAHEAIEAYGHAAELLPSEGDALFRLGVAHRMRFDSPQRAANDFQHAIQAWEAALSLNPNQYIWRRRIQQYGPRLDKPYPFYDWCRQAEQEIAARGETPIALPVAPGGAEIAGPSRRFDAATVETSAPDPQGKILRDQIPLIEHQVTVVPTRPKPGESARVHISLQPSADRQAYWNNEAEPLRLWIDVPQGWQVSQQLLEAEQGSEAETNERRQLDFEVNIPDGASGRRTLQAYALYYVCEGLEGTCVYRRLDIEISLQIAADEAP